MISVHRSVDAGYWNFYRWSHNGVKMYISNNCIFPVGWTVETLMSRHNSQPYNPDIAYCFYRAGYVETWGRGIEKICEECAKHGIPNPEYTLHPEDIMVKFTGYKPPKTPKG